eukprot:812702-Alexandrium_andersonii.AAC.1
MSASLVGSEMCIRDRRGSFGVPPFAETPGASELPSSDVHRFRAVESAACLLYTSDAADDM